MKTIQICGSYTWGGIEMQTFAISEALAQNGNEVTLICPRNSHFENEKSKYGVNLYYIDFKKSFFVILHSFIKAIKHLKPDVIHCYLSKDLRYIITALKYLRFKMPLAFTKHTTNNIRKASTFYQYFYYRIDKIYTISEHVKTNILTTTSVEQQRVEILHYGVNLKEFNPYIFNKNKERAKYSLSSNKIVVGFAGSISLSDDLIEFIEAAYILKELSFGNIQFIIAIDTCNGQVEYYDQIKTFAIQRLGESNVIFSGFNNIVPPFLLMMDILVFLTDDGFLGNVALEAMAMEVPVVASNCGYFTEIIKHNSTGILINAKNPHAIANGVLEFLLKRNNADIIRQNAVDYVKENHDLNLYITKLQKSYQSLIDQKSAYIQNQEINNYQINTKT